MSTIEFLDGMKDVLDHYISPLVKLIGIIGEEKFTFPSVPYEASYKPLFVEYC